MALQLIAFKLCILITLFLSAVTVNSPKDTSYNYLEHSSYLTHQHSVSLTAQSTAFHHEASVVTTFFFFLRITLICLLRVIYEILYHGTSVVKVEGGEESETISQTMCVLHHWEAAKWSAMKTGANWTNLPTLNRCFAWILNAQMDTKRILTLNDLSFFVVVILAYYSSVPRQTFVKHGHSGGSHRAKWRGPEHVMAKSGLA